MPRKPRAHAGQLPLDLFAPAPVTAAGSDDIRRSLAETGNPSSLAADGVRMLHSAPDAALVTPESSQVEAWPVLTATGPVHEIVVAEGSSSGSATESAEVRRRISEECSRLAQGSGIVRIDRLVSELERQRIIQVGPTQLSSILTRIDDLVELPGGWIGSIADRARSPLTRYLRRMVSVSHNLPLDVATAQLKRQNAGFAGFTQRDLAAFVAQHPDLVVSADRIRTRTGFGLDEATELSRDERLVHQAIRDARMPLSSEQIARHTRHRARIAPTQVKTCLRESCVLVPVGDGTFEALQPSERIRRLVLSRDQPIAAAHERTAESDR